MSYSFLFFMPTRLNTDEDPSRETESREQAKAVSKYVESMIVNAIRGGQNIGKNNGQPEGRNEQIGIV
jgi:hypothetical protein